MRENLGWKNAPELISFGDVNKLVWRLHRHAMSCQFLHQILNRKTVFPTSLGWGGGVCSIGEDLLLVHLSAKRSQLFLASLPANVRDKLAFTNLIDKHPLGKCRLVLCISLESYYQNTLA